jgi:3-oxoacyl-[acyl-carrier protein] reductase
MNGVVPVVLVTGASRGLGRGIAIELAKAGHSVIVDYARNTDAAEATAEECEKHKTNPRQKFIALQADVAKREDRARLLKKTLEQAGRIDALVNNAGVGPRQRADITEMSEQSFEEVLRTNLQGPFFLTQEVVNYWLGHRISPALKDGFKVVFITSISAYTASINRGEYCISKAGLSMSSQLWASRLAGEGIQVVEIRPGIMATDMTSGVKEKYDRLLEEGVVPQGRWGTPEDVGLAIRAIIRGDFPFSTGTIIDVDGGFRLRRL